MKEEGKGREGKEKLGWIDKVLHSGNSKVVFVRVRVCACTCVDVCESMLSVSVPGVSVEVRRDPQVPALTFPIAVLSFFAVLCHELQTEWPVSFWGLSCLSLCSSHEDTVVTDECSLV